MNTEVLELGQLLPRMLVEPPGPRSRDLAARLAEHESPAASAISRGEIPVFWAESQGANIVDVDGNVYVDITGGFFATAAGHSNPRIVAAIAEQAAKLMHSMGCINPNEPRVLLVEKLAEICPGDLSVSHVASTGGEAVDLALKTARLYTGRSMFISYQGGFHGKGMSTLAATARNFYRAPWQSALGGTVHMPFAYCYRCSFGASYPGCGRLCAEYLDDVLSNPDSGISDVAAVIMEPAQGVGGVIVPPPEFLPRVYEICHRHGILFIADEIITGFGRTGRWFAVDHAGVVPDMLVMGKGIASGFPVSAMTTTKEIASCWKAEQHTSTFLGYPPGCAAALAGIAEIEERDLVERSRVLGIALRDSLLELQARHPLIGDVRSQGLMAALELVRDREAKEPAPQETRAVIDAALGRGLMATLRGGRWGNVIRMAPPLTITEEQLAFAIHTLDESLTEVERAAYV